MDFLLTDTEARVLGSLMEKESTTPEYYPLSLNALVNACNQKNNREPVMTLSEDEVRSALTSLEAQKLAGKARADGRVAKFEHRMQEVFNFTRGEGALICTLLLRGPQTPGELRGRSERMHSFAELEDVLSTLRKLAQREPALVAVLPQQRGTREARYTHLFSGDAPAAVSESDQKTSAPAELFVLIRYDASADAGNEFPSLAVVKIFSARDAAEDEAERLRSAQDSSKYLYSVQAAPFES